MLHLDPEFREPFWVTPGGGLDKGESFEDAARRELYEEVGRGDLELGPCITEGDIEFTWEDWFVRQHERTFVVAVPDEFEAVVVHPGIEPIVGTAWFNADELRSLKESVYPEGLVELVEASTDAGASGVMGRAIFHIAVGSDWTKAADLSTYEPATLSDDGFVHCSYPWQLERVANAAFAGRRGLVLLRIDPDRVRAVVHDERPEPDAPPEAPLFPHVYGPIDVDAVTGVWPFDADADGHFHMPEEVLEDL